MIVDEFIEHLKANGKAYNTIRAYESTLRALYFKFDNPLTVSKNEFKDFIHAEHLKPQSRINRRKNLKAYFAWLLDKGLVLKNIIEDIPEIKKPKRLPSNVMTQKEAKKLLDSVKIIEGNYYSYRNRLMLEVMYSCSLRRSDLVNLNVDDYDKKERVITVRQQKTKKTRTSPVGESVATLLEEYLDNVRPYSECPAMFLNCHLRRLSAHTVTVMVTELRKKVGIKTKVTSHSFRKTSATMMLKNGAPMKSVQQMLGHSDLKTTMIYTKLHPSQIFKMHRSKHPREKEKRLKLPDLKL